MSILAPDLLWLDNTFVPDYGVEIDDSAGTVLGVAPLQSLPAHEHAVRLRGRALMPGLVNTHSHAFQRLIRGTTQWRGNEPQSDFWSWRDAMYAAALTLSPDDIYTVSRFCFTEMLLSGITTVGEFHYLHNDPAGRPYAERTELAQRVCAAARDVGIRIVLLNSTYATGNVRQPLRGQQRRFATPDLATFMSDTESLRSLVSDRLTTVGLAPHSVRAVPRNWLEELAVFARDQRMVLHMHVSEQRAEVESCEQAYGRRPVQLLSDIGMLSSSFTGVHCTHTTDAEIALLAQSGATVCACPGTERDLGDGFLDASALRAAGGRISLGSDSQAVIDLWEEMRLVEYNERLRKERRAVLTVERDGRHEAAPVLFEMATTAGARSLGINAGRLATGAAADFIAVDLSHSTLAGSTAATLAAHLALGAPAGVVSDVWVGGVQRVADRQHAATEEAKAAFVRVATR